MQLDGGQRLHAASGSAQSRPGTSRRLRTTRPLITLVRSASVTRLGVGKRLGQVVASVHVQLVGQRLDDVGEDEVARARGRSGGPRYISTPARWWMPVVTNDIGAGIDRQPGRTRPRYSPGGWGKRVVQGLVGVQRGHQQVGVLLSQAHGADGVRQIVGIDRIGVARRVSPGPARTGGPAATRRLRTSPASSSARARFGSSLRPNAAARAGRRSVRVSRRPARPGRAGAAPRAGDASLVSR